MSDKLVILCRDPQQAHAAISAQVWPALKSNVMAGNEMEVELRHAKRSSAENRMLHAMLGYIAKTQEWAGKSRDIDTWKRLLTAAWCRAIGEQVELLPALDGHGVDIVYRKTSELTRKECADLIEFIFAWGTEHCIVFPERPEPKSIASEPKRIDREIIDMETGEILQ